MKPSHRKNCPPNPKTAVRSRGANPSKCRYSKIKPGKREADSLVGLLSASVPERLTFKQACERLTPRHRPSLDKYLPYALAVARRMRRPKAEELAVAALVRAIVTFRRKAGSRKRMKVRKLHSWIITKVRYAMRNLAAEYPVSRVADAVAEFKVLFGRLPTLVELGDFSGIGSHQILNVWDEVADALSIDARHDPLRVSLRENLGWSSLVGPQNDLHNVFLVHQALKLAKPIDACLLVLKELCCYSEAEILAIIGLAHDRWLQTHSADEVDSCLDQFLDVRCAGLTCPWDFDLFTIASRGQLAVRQHRARQRFITIMVNLSDSCSNANSASAV